MEEFKQEMVLYISAYNSCCEPKDLRWSPLFIRLRRVGKRCRFYYPYRSLHSVTENFSASEAPWLNNADYTVQYPLRLYYLHGL
jgi:hypothetical protein